MFRASAGFASVLAAGVAVGAFHFLVAPGAADAFGNSLTNGFAAPPPAIISQAGAINRTAKTDRLAIRQDGKGAEAQRTVTLKPFGMSDTLIVFRLAENKDRATSTRKPVPLPPTPPAARPLLACESPVSLMAEAARHLGPGRCVT